MSAPFRIGSRKSELALRQSRMVEAALRAAGHATEIVTFSTVGDERLDVPMTAIGGKGLFTAELERALLAGDVDCCVHSLKDLPTDDPPGLAVVAILEREDPRDALVVRAGVGATSLADLPPGARIGSSSLRRAAQLRRLRPDLQVVDLRGNVGTRLRKLDEGQMDACILAAAGLVRLDLAHRITARLEPPEWLSAAGQGAIAVQARADDAHARAALAVVHHEPTARAVHAERAFLAGLDGGCQVPIGALCVPHGAALRLHGLIASLDGTTLLRGESVVTDDAIGAGQALAAQLRQQGAEQILATVRP